MDKKHPKFDENFLKIRPNPRAGDGGHEYLTLRDGARMFAQYWLPEGREPERVAVCLHGMSAHGWYFSLLADELAPRGVAVYVPDFRSHGLSDGVKGDLPNAAAVVEDMKEFVAFVRSRHPRAKVFTIGESMGGAVNINFMIDAPGAADGMVLLAPAIKPAMKFSLRDILKGPLYVLALLVRASWRVVKVTGDEHRGMRNEDNIRYDRNDPLHLKYVSTRYLLGVKRLMDRGARLGPARITAPALLIQGGKDVAVSPEGTREFYEKLASKDKSFVFYPEGFHCMTTDPYCTDLYKKVGDWILAH